MSIVDGWSGIRTESTSRHQVFVTGESEGLPPVEPHISMQGLFTVPSVGLHRRKDNTCLKVTQADLNTRLSMSAGMSALIHLW